MANNSYVNDSDYAWWKWVVPLAIAAFALITVMGVAKTAGTAREKAQQALDQNVKQEERMNSMSEQLKGLENRPEVRIER